MPEVDISGCGVVGSRVVTRVFLMVDEGFDLGLKIAWREAVFQQDAVLEGLVPALDLVWGLQMICAPRECLMPLSVNHSVKSPET